MDDYAAAIIIPLAIYAPVLWTLFAWLDSDDTGIGLFLVTAANAALSIIVFASWPRRRFDERSFTRSLVVTVTALALAATTFGIATWPW